MGCCDSKPKASRPNRNGYEQSPAMRVTSGLTDTGIMDEAAPETTAPKLDFRPAVMRYMINRITDLVLGECRVVDANIPEAETSVRELHYEQVFLFVRETFHAVNERSGLGVDVHMLPSQVNGLVAESKNRLQQGGVLKLPSFPTKKVQSYRAVHWRKSYVYHWLNISSSLRKDHVRLSTDELKEYHKKAQLHMPFEELLAALTRDRAASAAEGRVAHFNPSITSASGEDGTGYSYEDVMCCVSAWDVRRWTPLREVFLGYAPGGMMSDEQFAAFLESTEAAPKDKQGRAMTASSEFYRYICELGMRFIQKDRMSFSDFAHYVVSGSEGLLNGNRACRPFSETAGVYHDMSQPIQDYYIATSRNTWLSMTDQLTSDSSLAMISSVLQEGCRVVELDCHDGDGGDPTVFLSWTKNTPIPLRDCLETIKEHGFATSPFPVIISVTLHYWLHADAAKQMEKTAQLFRAVFGTSLAVWGDGGVPPSRASPDGLRYKFLLKCEKRSQEVSREHRATAAAEPLARRMSQANFRRARLGISVVDIKARLAVKVVSVEDGGIAARGGVCEGDFIEGVYIEDMLRPVRCVADFQAAVADPGALDAYDELRLRINQRDVCLVVNLVVTHPKHAAGGAGAPAFYPISTDSRMFSGNSSEAESESVSGGANAGGDSSDEEKPPVLLQWKRSEIKSRKKALGVRYKKLPVNKDMSSLAYLSPANRRTGAISGMWWEVIQLQRSQLQFFAPQDVANVTKTHIVNVTPDRSLLNSENFHPGKAREMGVQMIAMNYQNACENCKVAKAYFEDNARCGYVLKPAHLRSGGAVANGGAAANDAAGVSDTTNDSDAESHPWSTTDISVPPFVPNNSPANAAGRPATSLEVTVLSAVGLPCGSPTLRRVAVYLSDSEQSSWAARRGPEASPPCAHDAWSHTLRTTFDTAPELQMLVVTVFRDLAPGETPTPGYDSVVIVADAHIPLHLWAKGVSSVPLQLVASGGKSAGSAPAAGSTPPVAICHVKIGAPRRSESPVVVPPPPPTR